MGDYADDVNHYLVHHKDDLIGTITTDNSGFAYLADLYIGKYYIKEIVAGDGFVLNTYIDEFEITSAESSVNFILYESAYENERQKVDVTVTKKEADTEDVVQGAAFGLYNKADIMSYIKEENGKYVLDETGRKLLDADTLIATAVTGEDGTAHFDVDLPLGEYYVIELMPPAGFHSSDEVIELDATYAGQTVETIVLEEELENEPTKVEISKTDITTGEEIIGATLVIKDEDGNVVDEWVTDGEKHLIKYLLLGKTYTLSEKLPASGYVTADDVPFTILDRDTDGSILLLQKVEMVDDYTKVVLKKTDMETGEGVLNADLELRNKETDEVVASWTTTEVGEIINFHAANDQITYELEAGMVYITYLPIGEYVLVEVGTPFEEGYVTADPVDVVVEDTGDEQVFEMKDDFTKLDISKVEATTKEELPGAHLILKDKDGNVVDEWDSTDTPHRIERIPVGEYTFIEETAPFGYIIAEEITFEVEDTGVVQKVVMKDDYTVAELAKTDFTTGEPVIGATLTLYKAVEEADGTFSKGEVVLTWETTDGSEVPNVDGKYQYDIKNGAEGIKYWINENGKLTITHIPVGTYILEETITPDDYVTSEDVVVTIKNVGGQTEIQKATMFDKKKDHTFLKVDEESGKPLSGATLQLTNEVGKVIAEWVSEKEAYRIHELEPGKYTLAELKAPDGYLIANPITFEILPDLEAKVSIVMKDKKIPSKPTLPTEPEKPTEPTVPENPVEPSENVETPPQTGDVNGTAVLYIMLISLGFLLVFLIYVEWLERRMK